MFQIGESFLEVANSAGDAADPLLTGTRKREMKGPLKIRDEDLQDFIECIESGYTVPMSCEYIRHRYENDYGEEYHKGYFQKKVSAQAKAYKDRLNMSRELSKV